MRIGNEKLARILGHQMFQYGMPREDVKQFLTTMSVLAYMNKRAAHWRPFFVMVGLHEYDERMEMDTPLFGMTRSSTTPAQWKAYIDSLPKPETK